MARYIDAENAISVFEILADKCADDKAFDQAISVLKDVPTEDVVEVVRCKDCQHCEWYIKAHYKNGVEVESLECRKYKMAVTRDWFCADGERREE